MASKQQMAERETSAQSVEAVGEQALGPAAIAAATSVGLSLYYFFVRGEHQRGMFIGLWPPTILAFASYFSQRKMRRQLDAITQPGATLKSAIESVMGNK